MATTYKVNGLPATKAQYDQHNFLEFGGPDPNIKKERPVTPAPVPLPIASVTKPKAKFAEDKSENSLSSMLANSRGLDFARPNRFEVHIFQPRGAHSSGGAITNPSVGPLKRFTMADMRSFSLRCESVTMPFRALNTIEDANIYGPTREIVSGVSYAGDIDLVFQSNGDLGERVFFEEWQKQAFDETSWTLNYHKDYVSEIQIFLLDIQDKRRYGVVLHEAYPKTVNGVELTAGASTEIIKTTVGMSFRYWSALDITRQTNKPRQAEAFEQIQRSRNNTPASVSALGGPF
jgi:hypothetical protein